MIFAFFNSPEQGIIIQSIIQLNETYAQYLFFVVKKSVYIFLSRNNTLLLNPENHIARGYQMNQRHTFATFFSSETKTDRGWDVCTMKLFQLVAPIAIIDSNWFF